MKSRRILKPALFLAILALAALAGRPLRAATLTGTVTNGTTNKPAAGDTVVLVALQQKMQEVAHAKTDARGRFSIDTPGDGMYLVRVDHQSAAYFQPVRPGTATADVTVYDVSAAVEGVVTEANVLRFETDAQGLHVTESFFVKNDSNPPRTQFSNHSYEIYLPDGAQVEGGAAMGPGGMPVKAFPAPLGQKGLYAFLFPLRPGETQFQLSYRLPYSGSLAFAPQLATPADNLVVMLPKSMTFKPAPGAGFQPLTGTPGETPGAQTFLARSVTPGQKLAFTISGSGSMPRDTQAAQQGGQGTEGAGNPSAVNDTRPGGGLGTPIDTPDPLHKYRWWILGGIALLLVIAAAFLLRRPAESAPAAASGTAAPAAPPAAGQSAVLAALKEELFALETDRLQGRLSDGEYAELKSSLERVLRHALERTADASPAAETTAAR